MAIQFAIVGSGAFGLATALHLTKLGYNDIVCFDKETVPSPVAAANDSNKVVDWLCHEINDQISSADRVAAEAMEMWQKDEFYNRFYHQRGMVVSASKTESLAVLEKHANIHKIHEFLETPADFRRHIPVLDGPLENWKGYVMEPEDGWVHSRDCIKALANLLERRNVKFVSGDDGDITKVVEKDGAVGYLESVSGKRYKAANYIVCAGAGVTRIIDLEDQVQSRCWSVAHIKVSEEEASQFNGLPLLMNLNEGYYFEPDENDTVKVVWEFPGFVNFESDHVSVPDYTVPANSAPGETQIRRFLRNALPSLADRPFESRKLCWCAMTADRQLLICRHPHLANLTVASGDSYISFRLTPVIGQYIAAVAIKGNQGLNIQDRKTWEWRPGLKFTDKPIDLPR
ncbi:unnamed protein product [Kuraishia capsulata CBS 1993]|uniref:FAD dependent oxidoreductase domain-containing protein n=1 Tax=Kuraishia capsulata CBS 1993 TaxID=1382522 RepID=W6MRN2_9ASCO|nr:uncharacterized protein KUCA_T00003887001 [Kuraishia capsulata CBS 1993]CDK27907.1 unnamed protein product [Kuraishia capsulata CBS 1993]